jgi:serine/threonine-protein kinase
MGASLYALLSGFAPFRDASWVQDTLTKEPEPLPATVSARARELVARCLQKDPEKRFADGAELLRALEAMAGPAGAAYARAAV